MTDLDFASFEALTFDCYGTLIDWETGILAALRPILARHRTGTAEAAPPPNGSGRSDAELLEAFALAESDIEAGPYRTYREVLGEVLRRICEEHGITPTDEEIAAFGGSVVDWPPFADSAAALARLKERFRLGVITNCDDDLFAASNARLGVEFDWVITAQQVGSYKPSHRNFEVAFQRLGLPRERILHIAQSLFHDHVPAKALGLHSVWVDRRAGHAGSGATRPAAAEPDLVVPDMRTLADMAVPG